MPRSVDTVRHRERRDAILEVALRLFAEQGYDRTSTAAICRTAGVSSGTFFHYFPTKIDTLVGILDQSVTATAARIERIESAADGLAAVLRYVTEAAADLADPTTGGFIRAVSAVEHLPEVAEPLAREAELTSTFLTTHLAVAHDANDIRVDRPAETWATWVSWLLDGAAVQVAESTADPGDSLVDAVRALLVPAAR